MDDSPPGSSAHGILQARILEWVAVPFSRLFRATRLQGSLLSLEMVFAGCVLGPGKQEEKRGCGEDVENPLALLAGMQIDTTTMENNMEISLKTRNKTTI